MSTYAIGDIQGCYQSFQKLLNYIQFDSSNDQLWLLGDLINRGPRSLETMRFVVAHQKNVRCVLGNHDLHFLAVAAGAKKTTKKDTFHDLLNAPDLSEIIGWLSQQPLCYFDEQLNFAMAHAGIAPQWSLNKALLLAKEVEQTIQSVKAQEFYQMMYGNLPAIWQDDLAGMDRLRVITNYFTRMRFCRADGSLDLTFKGANGDQAQELLPWFEVPREKLTCQFLFGHWAALEGNCEQKGFHALDTGCVWGGKLTAMRLEDSKFFSIQAQEK